MRTTKPPIKIAPSLLSFDFANLARDANELINNGADWLHIDVMDGHFVPNLTIGAPVVKSLRSQTTAFLDCHLMVTDPWKWVDDFAKAGADQFIFHLEANPQVTVIKHTPEEIISQSVQLIKRIKQTGMLAGISLKPETEIDYFNLDPLVEAGLDYILIMTVEPGFGGQEFMYDMLDKVQYLRGKYPYMNIGVDGGVKMDNVGLCAEAGANVMVSGSGIYKTRNHKETISRMKKICDQL